ncbi:MAG: rhomboid family intramembrane serine protease [Pseudomonadota bacterium]
MFLPIGDQPNARGVPVVNYALLAANVAVFLLVTLPLMWRAADPSDPVTRELLLDLMRQNPSVDPEYVVSYGIQHLSAYDSFLVRWGYRPSDPSILTLFTSMFLHGGWLHLIGNMLFLWIYGDNVEHRLGRLGYLVAYLATGAIAALSFGAFVSAASGNTPMVGASGAISGVLGFYFLWFPRNKVRVLVVLFPFFFDVWLVGARIVLGFYLLIENLLPFLITSFGKGSGVAHGAHIGGFVAGLFAAFVLDRLASVQGRRRARTFSNVSPKVSRREKAGAQLVVSAVEAGDFATAVTTYLSLSGEDRKRVPVAVALELADRLAIGQQPDAALAIYRQIMADHPKGPSLDRTLLGIGLTLLHGKFRPAAAYQYLLDVLDVDPSPEIKEKARKGLAHIEHLQKMPVRSRQR